VATAKVAGPDSCRATLPTLACRGGDFGAPDPLLVRLRPRGRHPRTTSGEKPYSRRMRDVTGERAAAGRAAGWLRRSHVLIGVAALVVAVAVGVVRVWTLPDVFYPPGDIVSMRNTVGVAAVVGAAMPRKDLDRDAPLRVISAAPRIMQGQGEVTVLVCHTGPGRPGVSAVRGSARRFCRSIEAANGARLAPRDQLALVIRSDQPGRTVVNGIEVRYSQGWRRGTQVTGVQARIDFVSR
jgi:hypothetical protein